MKYTCSIQQLLAGLLILSLAACHTVSYKKYGSIHKNNHGTALPHLQPVRITKVSQAVGSQEILMQGMSLIGTPYRYGGSSRDNGFDCSRMVQYIYQQALQVALPRTARDMAAVSAPIPARQLKVGDLVFFNTNGQPYSHMGLYIGDGKFIHAPSSKGVIRAASLDQAYFKQRLTDTRTLFAR